MYSKLSNKEDEEEEYEIKERCKIEIKTKEFKPEIRINP